MEWQFAALLFGALVLLAVLSFRQVSAYTGEINRTARNFARPGRHLVSGRGRGRLRGAVAMLVVDLKTQQVIHAKTMAGVSVFARLRRCEALEGPLEGVTERAGSAPIAKAVADALTRLPSGPAAPMPTKSNESEDASGTLLSSGRRVRRRQITHSN